MRGNDVRIENVFDLKELGRSLKQARLDKNCTQDSIAKTIGIKRRSYIADIEGGRYMPTIATLAKMAAALDYDLNLIKDFILEEVESPEPNRRVFMKKYNKTKTEKSL